MVCWTIQNYSLEMKNKDITIFKEMLEARRNTVSISSNNQVLTWYGPDGNGSYNRATGEVNSRGTNLDWMKPAYTSTLVRQQAKRFGWKVEGEGENFIISK